MRTEKWKQVSPRFSIGLGYGNYLSTPAITWFGTPKRKHHKIFVHLVVLYVVFAWHRRASVRSKLDPVVDKHSAAYGDN